MHACAKVEKRLIVGWGGDMIVQVKSWLPCAERNWDNERNFMAKHGHLLKKGFFFFFLGGFWMGVVLKNSLLQEMSHQYVWIELHVKLIFWKKHWMQQWEVLVSEHWFVSFCIEIIREFGVKILKECFQITPQVTSSPKLWQFFFI